MLAHIVSPVVITGWTQIVSPGTGCQGPLAWLNCILRSYREEVDELAINSVERRESRDTERSSLLKKE